MSLSSESTWRGTSISAAQTQALGAAIARHAQPGDLVALIGELGAGKTQLVRGMASELSAPGAAVASPTFVMIHEYAPAPGSPRSPGSNVRKPVLVHVDAYRLRNEADTQSIGLASSGGLDELRRGAVVVVEWADRVPWLREDEGLEIQLTHEGENARGITIHGRPAWQPRLHALIAELDASLVVVPDASADSPTGAKCPICGKPVPPTSETLPFCTPRCRQVDLARWLRGDYLISRPLEQRDLED